MRSAGACAWLLVVACGGGEPPANGEQVAATVDLADLPPLIRPVYSPDVPLEGFWAVHWLPGFDSTVLELRREGEGFALTFFHAWCLGRDRCEARARWDRGALVLEEEAPTWVVGEPWQKLYPAWVEGQECLVPASSLDELGTTGLWNEETERAFRGYSVDDPTGFRAFWADASSAR